MTEEDGLTALEVRVARHDDVLVGEGRGDEGALEIADEGEDGGDFGAAVEPDVEGDLVVAAAGGVEFGSGGADARGEGAFDVHVDVFEGRLPFEGTCVDVGADGFEPGGDLGEFLSGEDPGFVEGGGVGDGAFYVVGVEAPVERDAFTELLDESGGFLLKSAFPHGVMIG